MGYLLASHIIKGEVDLGKLGQLPEDISFKAFRVSSADCIVIDLYRTGMDSDYPFQRMLPATGLPLEFDDPDSSLNELYICLKKASVANSFKRAFVNLNKMVSNMLNSEVLSIVSDDDGIDLAVKSKGGTLQRLHFRAEDLEILYEPRCIVIQPLLNEEEEAFVDLSQFEQAGFKLKNRDKEQNPELHYFATSSVKAFLGTNEPILGLGSFDPPPLELEQIEVQGLSKLDTQETTEKGKSSWWKFWGK